MPRVIPEYKEEAKNRILQAASKVFTEKGYFRATMDDIAKELNVSKGTLYLYFDNKEDLFREICGGLELQTLRSLSQGGNLVERAGRVFDYLKSSNRNLNFEILAEAPRNPPVKEIAHENFEKSIGVVEKFLSDSYSIGKGNEASVRTNALSLVSLYQGLMACLVVGLPESEVRQAWIDAVRSIIQA